MVTTIIAAIVLALSAYVFTMRPIFGKLPSGERLERIKKSPNYRDGSFQNIHTTPQLAEGETMLKVMKKFFFDKKERNKPTDALPSQKTNLKNLSPDENAVVWFGHSSYFMQIDGKKILVDPVLSGSASPIPITTKSYAGSDVYTASDIPEIDYLFITHDHYDHLDYDTVVKIKSKVNLVITGLGTGAHLESWGYAPEKIIERDWNEHVDLTDGFSVDWVTARHFSGRTFKRNQSLWTSFALNTPSKKIFLGGDSGYGTHFESIGKQFGPFDLAILECGQYNNSWKYIHMLPDELIPAAKDLKAKVLLPVHWGKFSLANHPWDEPIVKVSHNAQKENIPLVTPMIGEQVNLDAIKVYDNWWKKVR